MLFLTDPHLALFRVFMGAIAIGGSVVALFIYQGDVEWAKRMSNGQSYLRLMANAQMVRETLRLAKEIVLTLVSLIWLWLVAQPTSITAVIKWSNIGTWLMVLVFILYISTTLLDLYMRRAIQKGAEHRD